MVALDDRRWLVEIANGSTDPFPEDSARLASACGDPRLVSGLTADAYYACRAKYIKPARYRIAEVHATPSEASPVVASLFEERRVATNNQLEFIWTLEMTDRPGRQLPWPDSVDAFDYGLHISGAHRRGDWVRLLTSIPVDGWLRITPEGQGGSIYVWVSALPGTIVDLSPLLAIGQDGRERPIGGGPYLVKSVSDTGMIEFREKIPSDYSCGEPVIDPVPLPPTLRSRADEFFYADGTPRFSMTYTKGC